MCVNLAVEMVNIPFENELLERGYDRIVHVDTDAHAHYFEANHGGESLEVKVVLDQEELSIRDRSEGCEDWDLVDYLN